MTNNTNQMFLLAVLKRVAEDEYAFVLRWMLGKEGNELPRIDDTFSVEIRTTKSVARVSNILSPTLLGKPAFVNGPGRFARSARAAFKASNVIPSARLRVIIGLVSLRR